jgi:hypothetical protein
MSEYGEQVEIVRIIYPFIEPSARCAICVREVKFASLTKNSYGEWVCDKCIRPTRVTTPLPTSAEVERTTRKQMNRFAAFLFTVMVM